MKVLVIGSGGREHALCWAISQSPELEELYCLPGNGGIREIAICLDEDQGDFDSIVEVCREKSIDLVVVGPEQPLVDGVADRLAKEGISCFGPSAAAAQLEGSKGFMKDLCAEHGIPTAKYQRFETADAALTYVRSEGAPIVIKADGLAAGKGVIMAETLDQAEKAIGEIFGGKFGAAGAEVVVEEWMEGEEASFFAVCDGTRILALPTAQDHKRVGDGDTGLNTGGMGAYSPAPVMTQAIYERTVSEIIEPTVKALADRGAPYRGVFFAGLMITKDGPRLIEYNVRFGDPECQVLMMRLNSDILTVLKAAADGDLSGEKLEWTENTALTVVLAANGYPESYEKGTEIKGLHKAEAEDDVEIFHAGTRKDGDRMLATGGRVLAVTALAESVSAAQKLAYDAVDKIDWPGGFCRRDIGWRAVERERGNA